MNEISTKENLDWIIDSDEPWTRYRSLVDLIDQYENLPVVQSARNAMLDHPLVQSLIYELSTWPGYALKRHNDAKHPIYKFSTLADFGVNVKDKRVGQALDQVLSHQSSDGAFETLVFIPKAFGGSNRDEWAWILCDSPTLLYTLIAMGLDDQPHVRKAIEHLVELVEDNGWRCTASPNLGKFKGPGRKSDPCPIANVYALKALSLVPDLIDSKATRAGTEALLRHWQLRKEKKYFLFGMGTDFSKIKYPFVWYDILHVLDVLSRFSFVHDDPRFLEMIAALIVQSDNQGRYIAQSMYRAWKEWSFANKKEPSPWLTFLVFRVLKRIGRLKFNTEALYP